MIDISTLSDTQKSMWIAETSRRKKDKTTAFLLNFFLGGLGAHHIYLGKTLIGVLYCIFCWTFIPVCIAFIDLFLSSGRVDAYNAKVEQDVYMEVTCGGTQV